MRYKHHFIGLKEALLFLRNKFIFHASFIGTKYKHKIYSAKRSIINFSGINLNRPLYEEK